MKVVIEVSADIEDTKVIIQVKENNQESVALQSLIYDTINAKNTLVYYQGNKEFYFSEQQILFFETDGRFVYAHTKTDSYQVHERLYELETRFALMFIRISKSALVNIKQIYTLNHNVASSVINFKGTEKDLYVSRRYYKSLKQRLAEERNL